MSNITTPIQALLAKAARSLPATTGATADYAKRFAGATVILCDCSGSMADAAGGGKTREAHLKDALGDVLPSCPPGTKVVAFSSVAGEVAGPGQLPPPSGGTALHLALDRAANHKPRRTLVISDGQPDSEELALVAAAKVSGVIDVIYCGPDGDAKAIAFMHRLARAGGGRVVVRDLSRPGRTLSHEVRAVLMLPGD